MFYTNELVFSLNLNNNEIQNAYFARVSGTSGSKSMKEFHAVLLFWLYFREYFLYRSKLLTKFGELFLKVKLNIDV